MKQFIRHHFNMPLAVLLIITAVVFITAGIITGKNAARAEAAEADSSGTLFAGSDGNFDLSDADKKFHITEQIGSFQKKFTEAFTKSITYLKNGGKIDISSVGKVLKILTVPGVVIPAVLIFAFIRKR